MNSVGIIGFGRFGKILSNILQKGFMIKVYDIQSLSYHNGVQFTTLEEVLQELCRDLNKAHCDNVGQF